MKYLNGGDFVTLPWQELVRCRGGGKTRWESSWVGRRLKVKVNCFFYSKGTKDNQNMKQSKVRISAIIVQLSSTLVVLLLLN